MPEWHEVVKNTRVLAFSEDDSWTVDSEEVELDELDVLAAFGVGKGSAKMPEEEVRKIEIAHPKAFCRSAKAGGARVCGVMTAEGADAESGMKYAKIIGDKETAGARPLRNGGEAGCNIR